MDYSKLSELYKQIETHPKRLEKTYFLSEFLKKAKQDELPILMLLFQGRVFPKADERKIGVAARNVLKAINISTGKPVPKIEEEWKKIGDLGETAAKLVKHKTQGTLFSKKLSVKKAVN